MDLRKPIEFLHALMHRFGGSASPVPANQPEHTAAVPEGLRRKRSTTSGTAPRVKRSPVERVLVGRFAFGEPPMFREQPRSGSSFDGAVRSCNCGKYDRRCFCFGYLVCAPGAEFFNAESCILRYVDGVVEVAARLDIVLGIRLIDGS
jgi:hypothetical protein